MTDVTSANAVPSERRSLWFERVWSVPAWGPTASFLGIVAQLALLFLLLRLFEIEPGSGVERLLPLLFFGFLVHAALPLQLRLPFFVLLSLAAIGIVIGPTAGLAVVVIGLLLIGICHLPIPYLGRVLGLLIAAAILAAFRAAWLTIPQVLASSTGHLELPKSVLPVLGSMFMFRLIIYMYELRHEERPRPVSARPSTAQPATVWTRLGYFFLLPNVCFLLFPIIDYRTYRRTYYDSDAQAIYQKGVWWICLGLIQLLVYRLVYHYLIPMPEDVQGLAGIARYMTSAYLVYLRVVGQFQLIMGLLCLFGFNLPPAHRFYLLAAGFTDFWRRARIDWKDFMVKVFYYPSLVPLQRRRGAMPALVASTALVFFVTWVLHSYQWFWLLGEFRLLGNDAAFWAIIGACVLVNSVLEARKPRAAAATSWSTRRAVVHSAKVVGMFVFMSVLWSYWSSPSLAIWLSYLTAAEQSGLTAWAALLTALVTLIAFGVLAQLVLSRAAPAPTRGVRARMPRQPVRRAKFGWRPAAVFAAAALLLLLRVPSPRAAADSRLRSFASTLSTNTLNDVDEERQQRGYYEVLLDVSHSTPALTALSATISDAAASTPDGPRANPDEESSSALADAEAATTAPSGTVQPDKQAEGQPAETSDSSKGDTAGFRTRAPAAEALAGRREDTTASTVTPRLNSLENAVLLRRNWVFGNRPYDLGTNDMRLWTDAPNFVGSFRGMPFRTNRWGMRDKNYSLTRPPHTYRMALLGTSMTVGDGVPVEQTMETLLEDRLNREGPGTPRRHYEILNFSVDAYGILQNVVVLDNEAFRFQPNAILVGVSSAEVGRMSTYLLKLVKSGQPIPYLYVHQKLAEAGVNSKMQRPELLRRLAPIDEDLVLWSYRHILETCRQRGVAVVGIVLPEPRLEPGHDIDETARLAAAAGLPLLDLRGVYENQPVDSLRLGFTVGTGRDDPHWNVRGHKLIADKVYDAMRANDTQTLRLGFSQQR